ncbi:MAG: serine/threonine protein kinase [Bacteriovoracaceae bacterium]|nr:serine/threonine protein kinase [Bacteriovoracaceae bacterium]
MTKTTETKSNNTIQRFGKYLILDHLVDGGMAKICRARTLGEQADKVVVIKMIQPQFSNDESFRTMFLNEIKVTFGLIHPNIAQTYDYGMQNGQLYTAMEYVDGKNLRQFINKLKTQKFVFPIEITVYIISQACQGLHYAHTLTDKLTGKATRIIHRDISPHNIMITFDGAVKIIDFGIAKAATNSDTTQVGTIKGKLSYIAPEYLEGKDLDPRYDEFALGITMWEMLCSRKLFLAKNDIAILKQIQTCKIPPPSSINPNVPAELDEIVLKALTKKREDRYENLDKFNRALVKFLYSTYPDFNPTDLSYFGKELFEEDIAKDKRKIYSFGQIDLAPYIDELKSEQNRNNPQTPPPPQQQLAPAAAQATPKRAEGTKSKVKPTPSPPPPREIETLPPANFELEKKSKKNKPLVQASEASPKKKSNLLDNSKKSSKPSNEPAKAKVQKEQAPKKNIPTSGLMSTHKKPLIIAATVVFFIMLLSMCTGGKQATRTVKKAAPVIQQQKKNKVLPTKGRLNISNYDRYKQRIFINGKQQKLTILGDMDIQFGDNYILRVEQRGKEHYVHTFTVAEQNPTVKLTIPSMPAVKFAYLMTSHECTEGKIFFKLFGEERVETIPLKSKIAFPLKTNRNGSIAPRTFEISYLPFTKNIRRKITLKVEDIGDAIDFCDLIAI